MTGATQYVCPMHADVRQERAGNCPHCGMALVPEGARFGFLRHMLGSPLHVVVMAVVMLALMAAGMMLMK